MKGSDQVARPAKSVKVVSKNLSKEEIKARTASEEMLKGKANKLKPFDYLTLSQINIFNYIVSELTQSKILGNLDVYILNKIAIAIDRLNYIEMKINVDYDLMFDADVLKSRKDHTADFNKCCQELCLSPQARAKFGMINLNKKTEDKDPLLKVLRGGG